MAQPYDPNAMDDSETDDDDDESGYDTGDTIDAENPSEADIIRLERQYARDAAKRLKAAQRRQQAPSTPPPTNMIVDTPSTLKVVPDHRTRGLSDIQPLKLFDDDDAKNDTYKGKGGASKSKSRRRRSKRRRAKKTLRKRRTSRKRRTARRRKTRSKK